MKHSMHSYVSCSACGDFDGCHIPAKVRYDRLSFEEAAEQLAEWSQKTFGTDQERGPIGPLKHLAKEVKESLEKPSEVMEYADCLILVFDAARRAGFDREALRVAVNQKLKINLARKWPKPTSSDEPVEHVSDGS